MLKKLKSLSLPEGNFDNELIFFDENDKPLIKKCFKDWADLCKSSLKIGGTRIPNIPESVTEAILSLELNVGRCVENISGSSSSFDLYDVYRKKRIQLKAATSTGPTSFGPKSQYDEIYFMYFREIAEGKRSNNFSGKYEIYKLDTKIFPKLVLNKSKNETFEDQQKAGRRPRLSIPQQILDNLSIKPISVGNIDHW